MTEEAPEISVALWDIDGTLIDTTTLIVRCLDETFRRFVGKSLPTPQLRGLIGTPLVEQMQVFGDPAQFGSTISEMADFCVSVYEAGRDEERIITDAIDALIALKQRGWPTALVTSKSEAEAALTLPRLGIAEYCDTVVTADQVAPNFKPHPRPVLLALERLGVADPQTAVFIGDSVHDMKSGRSAGVQTAAVTWGAALESALQEEMPTFLFTRPSEIVAALTAKRSSLVA